MHFLNWLFLRPNKDIQRKSSSELLLTAKNAAEGYVPCYTSLGPSQFLNLSQKYRSKINPVLEPKTGSFRGLVGFKAKDFKMCPRGLHL